MGSTENAKDILVIYEQEAEEWALYLKCLFGRIVNKGGILLCNLETSSFQHQELFSLSCYKCKLLILSYGLLNCLNRKRSYFLEQVLRPSHNVVILLCGVENSKTLYEMLTLDGGSKEISADQEPEEYLSVVTGIIQPDYPTSSDVNLSGVRGASEKTDSASKTLVFSETLETNKESILVLPRRISCENPGEIVILLKDEIDDETVEIEFIADNKRIRIQPGSWNKKVKYVKALDFPAGPVYVNVYCGEVIKTTAHIEYYTALEEVEHIFKKVADPIAFICQINTTDNVTSCKEEAEDGTYMLMLCSESQLAMTLKAKQNPGDQYGIQSGCQQEAEVEEEKKDYVEDSREETEDEDREQEDPYSFDHSPDDLYASIPDDLKDNKIRCCLSKGPPPPPPRNPPGIQRLGDLHNLSQGTNVVEDRSERERGDGLTADQDTCEEDSEEEYPYSFAGLDESVYAFILAEEDEEKRKECRSSVMNRPPAPAPRPMCSVVREENTPYIMQAALRGHTDAVTESTVKHNIPAEQQELIHLQEQVKKGTVSVDEVFDRFKQWQKEKQRLESPQQSTTKQTIDKGQMPN